MESQHYNHAPDCVNSNGIDMRCGARHWGGGAHCFGRAGGNAAATQSATLTTIDTLGSLASWQGDDGTIGTLPTLESLPAWHEDQQDSEDDEAAFDTEDEFDHPRVHHRARCQGPSSTSASLEQLPSWATAGGAQQPYRPQDLAAATQPAPTWASEGGAHQPYRQQDAAAANQPWVPRQQPAPTWASEGRAQQPYRQQDPAAANQPSAPRQQPAPTWASEGGAQQPYRQQAPAAPPGNFGAAGAATGTRWRPGGHPQAQAPAAAGPWQAAGSAAWAADSQAPSGESTLALLPPRVPNDPAELHRGPQGEWLPPVVTLMISGIPIDVKQRGLMDLIDRTGFVNRFDYAYLPRNFHTGTSQGHAFVNFVTPSDAVDFYTMWNGAQLVGARPDAAVLKIRASVVQGFEENTKSWTVSRLRRVRNPEFRAFIADGRQGAAP